MRPLLPHHDPSQSTRNAAVEEARDGYTDTCFKGLTPCCPRSPRSTWPFKEWLELLVDMGLHILVNSATVHNVFHVEDVPSRETLAEKTGGSSAPK